MDNPSDKDQAKMEQATLTFPDGPVETNPSTPENAPVAPAPVAVAKKPAKLQWQHL